MKIEGLLLANKKIIFYQIFSLKALKRICFEKRIYFSFPIKIMLNTKKDYGHFIK